jgi:N-methylhydantoinase A
MERALRVISVERGFDPADLALVAFGGAGALHAAELATRLGCAEALVPPASGLLSAWGILAAPATRERASSVLADTTDGALEGRLAALAEAARAELESEGVPAGEIGVERRADLRYRGQSFELTVDAPDAPAAWAERFHAEHRRRYGYAHRERTVEVVTLRAIAAGPERTLSGSADVGRTNGVPARTTGAPGTPSSTSRIHVNGEWLDAPVHRRDGLAGGTPLEGPAVVLDEDATVWVPEGYRAELHESGVLRLRRATD